MAHNIHKSLIDLAVPIDSLSPDQANARLHRKKAVEFIKRSMSTFGQDQVIIARKDGRIVKGHGRYQAARELGWTHVAAIFVNDGDQKAIARAIADNRSSELSRWNKDALAASLRRLQGTTVFEQTGFTANQVDRLVVPKATPAAPADEPPAAEPAPEVLAKAAEAVRMVQVIVSKDEFERVTGAIATLQERYKTQTFAQTVLEAARRVAAC